MEELWLKFIDTEGQSRRERVGGERFIVGRQSDCDLCIPDGKLSREHLEIERIGYNFIVSDLGSSNGTTLNGANLSGRVALSNGDRLNLGGSIEMTAEFASEQLAAAPVAAEDNNGQAFEAPAAASSPRPQTNAEPEGGFPMSIFLIAPVLGLLVILLVGGSIYMLSGGKRRDPVDNNDVVYKSDDEDDKPVNKKAKSTDDDEPSNQTSSPNTSSTPDIPPLPSPSNTGEGGKSEVDGAAFLRRIALNDPKAFLTGEQAKLVNDKIKQVTSPALADNINAARQNSAKIKSIAESKSLKPQFLATAAITKLGSNRGDVLQTAEAMAETFEKLRTPVGNEFASDALLMVAAYDQGAAGDFLKMRNMLQDIATKYPESSRSIRTIWFLHKNNRITDAEYDFALRFLAVGTIMQNPKDFGVNTEALTF
ncbi:MAG TPA: FHA domain-containing protein [Pyrinomonadaceae bacterium]|nr:FHA domain-containing protein [Pyrinomonadaceae bacterium]